MSMAALAPHASGVPVPGQTGGGVSSTPGHLGANIPPLPLRALVKEKKWSQWLRALWLSETMWHV